MIGKVRRIEIVIPNYRLGNFITPFITIIKLKLIIETEIQIYILVRPHHLEFTIIEALRSLKHLQNPD